MTAPVLNARTIVESALYQQVLQERDRLRHVLTEIRADHADNGSGWCGGDHAAMFVAHPCEVRDACDEALHPGSTS